MPAGYSGTPLARKLGLKPGMVVHPRGASRPDDYAALLGAAAADELDLRDRLPRTWDVVHLFTADRSELARELPRLDARMADDAAIWVSWPKKASKVPSTVTEDVVRELALPLGLVDVKVCAVDDVFSGLRLVRRRTMRA